MRYVVLGAALVGGICLAADLYVMVDPLRWAGLGLLALAVAGVGAGLARVSLLRVVCAVGSVALGWAVLETLRAVAPDRELEAVVGGLATLCVALAVLRRPTPGPPAARRGNHR